MQASPTQAGFREAFDQAVRNYGNAWALLTPADQTAAIYREMRRIDAERFGVQPFSPRTLNAGLARRFRRGGSQPGGLE